MNLSAILNASRTLRHSCCTEYFILLHLVHLILLCMNTIFQDWKLLSHTHLRTPLNVFKITNLERRILLLEMLQLSDI